MSAERKGFSPNQEAPKPTTPDLSTTIGLDPSTEAAAIDALIDPAQVGDTVTPESELDSMESHEERLLEGKRRKRVYDDAKEKYGPFLREHGIKDSWSYTANKHDQDNPFIPELKKIILELLTLAADAGLIEEFDPWDMEFQDIVEHSPPALRSNEQRRELNNKCVCNAIRFGLDDLVLSDSYGIGEPIKKGLSKLGKKLIEGKPGFFYLTLKSV